MKLETILRRLDIHNLVNEENEPIEMIEDVHEIETLVFRDKKTEETLYVVFDIENGTYEFENDCRFNDQQFNTIMLYCNYIKEQLLEQVDEIESIRNSIFDSLEWS